MDLVPCESVKQFCNVFVVLRKTHFYIVCSAHKHIKIQRLLVQLLPQSKDYWKSGEIIYILNNFT